MNQSQQINRSKSIATHLYEWCWPITKCDRQRVDSLALRIIIESIRLILIRSAWLVALPKTRPHRFQRQISFDWVAKFNSMLANGAFNILLIHQVELHKQHFDKIAEFNFGRLAIWFATRQIGHLLELQSERARNRIGNPAPSAHNQASNHWPTQFNITLVYSIGFRRAQKLLLLVSQLH